MAAWVLTAFVAAFVAAPVSANTCSPATTRGTAPADYQDYCWLDFSGYSDSVARSTGQKFSYALPDGSTLSLTLQVSSTTTGTAIVPTAVPSWSGAAFGNSGFIGIPGKPVLYEGTNGSTVQVTLSNIAIAPPAGSSATSVYAIVAADGESTNGGETLSFTTNGTAWTELAAISNGNVFPTLGGVGTGTVTETGVDGTVGAYAFSSLGNPTTIGSTLVGSGLQGAIFALRYASISLTAQLSGARATASDQFTYGLATTGGSVLASATSTGTGTGPFPAASLPLLAATYPFVVSETMASGSTSTLANYGVSLTCTNASTGSSTSLPTNLAANTYTFPALNYGDAVSCVFTDTANRANLGVTKTGPATVAGGGALSYTLAVSNQGPSDASGSVIKDPAVANFTAAAVTCGAASGGAVCPANAVTTVANLQGAGITIPTLPSGGALSFTLSGTAGAANITNTASIAPPATVVNSNTTPTSTVTTTVTAAADLATTLVFPASINAGQTVSGTVSYTNNGPSVAAGVTYNLALPANLAAAPVLTGLPTGAAYTYAAGTGIVTLTGMPATLASGASAGPISVSYVQPPAGTSVVTASDATTTTDPNLANDTASATIGGNPEADLLVALTFPTSVNAGLAVTGTVTYTNNGPSTATGPVFTLTLPANLATAPTLTNLPTGASYTYTAGTGVVSFSGMPATLASGATAGPITVSYAQPGAATSTVTAGITATTADPNAANNTASATIGGIAEADLATTLNFPASVNAGGAVTGTVLYTNNGPSAASLVSYTLTLPANLSTAPTLSNLPTGASYTYTAGTGVVSFTGMPATLASAASAGPITVSYVQPGTATSTVTAGATATTADPNAANNTVTATIGGTAEADLATTLHFPSTVNAGLPVSGTIQFSNNGPSVAAGVSYSVTLSANLATPPTLSGLPTGATYSYNASSGVVTFAGMPTTLAAAATLSPITVAYTQPSTGNSVVTAGVAATTTDPNAANNNSSATIAGSALADVTATLSFPANVNAGQTVTGTVMFTNNGPSTAAAVTFLLTLPSNLGLPPQPSFPSGVSYVYTPSTGVVTLNGMPTTLASGASFGPITISYIQPGSAASAVNASIASTTMDPNPNNNAASAMVTGAAEADLTTLLHFPANANAGASVAGTVTYTNIGPSTASGVAATLTLPANLTTPPTLTGLPTGAAYTYVASTGIVTLTGLAPTLAAGTSIGPITVLYLQPGSGDSTVSAAATATTNDPQPGNNAVTATITGIPLADLSATLSMAAHANAGQPVVGTLLFANHGPSAAAGVTYTLSLPTNLDVPPAITGLPTGTQVNYVAATGVVSFTGMPAALAANTAIGPIAISYAQSASGTSTVSAAIAATTQDPITANNTASTTITGSAAELRGTVYLDNNQDGVFDAGDTPVAGATVTLLAGARVVATVSTDATGYYSFTAQPAGSYNVAVTLASGYLAATPPSVAAALTGNAAVTVNFGEIPTAAVGALVLTKTTPLVNISAGQSVPYTITATNPKNTPLDTVTVTDVMPAGFSYRAGSGAINGKKQDPTVAGHTLSWTRIRVPAAGTMTFTLVLTAGAGVGSGEFVNQAMAYNGLTNTLISNIASATVRISGDPTFDCPDLIGKVFDDTNANGREDPGEKGIAGVRLVTAQGLLITTDAEGRYHIACPITPDAEIGTNFIVKLDERTLPSGYRLTTDNPETVRLTTGKVSKLNFGATIHHVIRIEIDAGAFAADGSLSAEVTQRIAAVVAQLGTQAGIVRLAYVASDESDAIAEQRLKTARKSIEARAPASKGKDLLRVEEEIVRSTRPRGDARGAQP